MNATALIFAGGTGTRMSSRVKPKQFLDLFGKPIIIHTLEYFERNAQIDRICVVCLEGWIGYLRELLVKYGISKATIVVPGGATGMESIFNGLRAVYAQESEPQSCLMLMHDGVRPLINDAIITECIECARKNGNAITVTSAYETIITVDGTGALDEVIDRKNSRLARAPQCFFLEELYSAHLRAQREGYTGAIDSATLMRHYGATLYTVEGPVENIKITTATDYYMAKAIIEARENSQIFG